MARFLRIAAYTFLALSGMYAWLSMQTGWRHYLGLGIFFFASVRIMILLFPRALQGKKKEGADASQPPGSSEQNNPPD